MTRKQTKKSAVNQPDIRRVIMPQLKCVLKPAGGKSSPLLPTLSNITPQYIEATLRGALAGNHVQAWELFDLMIDTDPEIAASLSEYVDAVANLTPEVTPYIEEGVSDPSPSALKKAMVVSACFKHMQPDMAKDENDLFGTFRDILFSGYYGQSVLEIDWCRNGGKKLNKKTLGHLGSVVCPRATSWVHPVCYAWDMNGRLGLRESLKRNKKSTWISSIPGRIINFPPNKFLIGIDKFKAGTVMGSGSRLRTLAFWWIATHYTGDSMLRCAQLFGIPFRTAKYAPNTTEQVKQELRQMMESIGENGYALIQSNCDIQYCHAPETNASSPQEFLFKFGNAMKRRVILGREKSGIRLVESVLNQQFIPAILNVNFGDDLECPSVRLVDEAKPKPTGVGKGM